MFVTIFNREKSVIKLKVTVSFIWLPVVVTRRRESESEDRSRQT